MTLNVFSINTQLCASHTQILFDWEIGRGKKKKGIVPQVVILFLDMHPKYLYYNDYGFI